jgi:site-specific recombinase XerD
MAVSTPVIRRGKVVAQLMGHANVDTTLNVYTQVLDGSLRTAVEKVVSELFTIVHKTEGSEAQLS